MTLRFHLRLLLLYCLTGQAIQVLVAQDNVLSPPPEVKTVQASADKHPFNDTVMGQPVYDLDSNRYQVVKIGRQYWLRENLRTTWYNDTSRIPNGLRDEEWAETRQGAYAVYDNNPLHEAIYGKLYNGYAVRSGKLCPAGWRIPDDEDWNELESFLGVPPGELTQTGDRGAIGAKLKGGTNWNPSDYNVTNESGLLLLPAGARKTNGEYQGLGQYANFWTATVYDDRYGLYLWNRHWHYNSNASGRIYTDARNGFSCRCILDQRPEEERDVPGQKKLQQNSPVNNGEK